MSTDQPTPHVGDAITTAEQLAVHQRVAQGMTYRSPDRCRCGADVLPEDGEGEASVRRDRAFAEHQAAVLAETSARPDAPHPAPVGGAAVERVARAIARASDADYWVDEIATWEGQDLWEREAYPGEYPESAYEDRDAFVAQARAALVAARAGEAAPRPAGCCGKCPPIMGGGYDCTCEGNPRCQRGGDAVDREALVRQVQDAFDGCIDATAEQIVVDLMIAARGDAAPSVSAEQVREARLLVNWTHGYAPIDWADALLAALGIEVRS